MSNFQRLGVSYSPEDIATIAMGVGMDKKGTNPVILDLRSLNVFAEYFAILSASNTRQVYAIADTIKVFFKKHFNLAPVSVDGLETSNWILLDYGPVFIHIFLEETRSTYSLEQLWAKAHPVEMNKDMYESLLKEINQIEHCE